MKQPAIKAYVAAFGGCIALTLCAYAVATGGLHRTAAMIIIGLLATVQCGLQLVQFLHLGDRDDPNRRWKLWAFVFMLMVVGILVIGSIWIIDNLNLRMTPQQMEQYMRGQDGL